MAHSLPDLTTCSGLFSCFADWIYTITNGMGWVFALLGFCVVIYAVTSRLGSVRAFGFSSIVGMIGSIYLTVGGWMVWWIAAIFILMGGVGLVVLIMNERG